MNDDPARGYRNWQRLAAETADAARERRGDPLLDRRQRQQELPPKPQKLDTMPINWHAEIKRAVDFEKTFWRDVLPELVAAQRDEIIDEVEDALRRRDVEMMELRAAIATTEAKLAEVRVSMAELAVASDKGRVIELPRLLRPHVN